MSLLTSSAFCLLGILMSSLFLGAEAQSCAKGWMQSQGNCYAYFDEQLTWAEAEVECQSYRSGSQLASVLNQIESDLLAKYITRYQKNQSDVWIGLLDVRQNGKWRWADESIYNYEAWMEDQPNNLNKSEYCVELAYSTQFIAWNDASCQKGNAYVCKYVM
ncbi:C-type lectin BpLec-like [Tiliqua scincoides]|uniref:C-type lectin BpLec-like n=1 Tax=Tiliqua scincoides TaxID=71010 RepID=UPI003462C2C2